MGTDIGSQCETLETVPPSLTWIQAQPWPRGCPPPRAGHPNQEVLHRLPHPNQTFPNPLKTLWQGFISLPQTMNKKRCAYYVDITPAPAIESMGIMTGRCARGLAHRSLHPAGLKKSPSNVASLLDNSNQSQIGTRRCLKQYVVCALGYFERLLTKIEIVKCMKHA